ncbi:MAG: hypothetical protein ABIB97_01050 [Patescibacteria group bacterium]
MISFGKKILAKKSSRNIIYIILSGVLVNVSNWIYLAITLQPKSEPIPLHYNIYFGIDLIGVWYNMYAMPFSGLLIIGINIWLLKIVKPKDVLTKYFLAAGLTFAQVILLLATVYIITQTG